MFKQTIFGPPGTGKTTYLMSLLEEELTTKSPQEIAFVSFTRKGTYEGADRAKKRFGLKKEELIYFRTLHSLCFKEMGVSRLSIITKKHYKLLSKTTGINFAGYYTEDFTSTNDEYLHVISMEKHNPYLAKKLLRFLNAKRFKYIKYQYNEMKKQLGIVDFDDLLINYFVSGKPLQVKTAFVDEAQDLTPLQWAVALKMFNEVEKLYVAGDDDQAVYEWSGADVKKFLKFTDNNLILDKSYRLPESILRLSKRITKDIKKRKDKVFKSNGKKGIINMTSSLKNLSFQGGELVLARTNYILRGLSFAAMNQGVLFTIKGKSSADKKVLRAIKAYQQYQQGEVSKEDIRTHSYYFESLYSSMPWQQVINLPNYAVTYYERILSSDALKQVPVKFETFHSSKGSENDHVIVCPDITAKVLENFYNQRDAELRCLYVGVTRAKEKLTILSPSGKEHYPDNYFN